MLTSKDITFCCLGYVQHCLCAISFALLAAATKARISTHNWNVSKRVVAELNYRAPLFSSSSPPESKLSSIRKKSWWWRWICLFIRNLDKPRNVLKRQEMEVVTGSDFCCIKSQQTVRSEISLHLSGAPRSRSHDLGSAAYVQWFFLSVHCYYQYNAIISKFLSLYYVQRIVVISILLWPIHLHVQRIVVISTLLWPIHLHVQYIVVIRTLLWPIHLHVQYIVVTSTLLWPIHLHVQYIVVTSTLLWPIHLHVQCIFT